MFCAAIFNIMFDLEYYTQKKVWFQHQKTTQPADESPTSTGSTTNRCPEKIRIGST